MFDSGTPTPVMLPGDGFLAPEPRKALYRIVDRLHPLLIRRRPNFSGVMQS